LILRHFLVEILIIFSLKNTEFLGKFWLLFCFSFVSLLVENLMVFLPKNAGFCCGFG